MWRDLEFTADPSAYYYFDGARTIISFVGVPPLSDPGSYDFQAILYPDGRIVYQYQNITADSTSLAVGWQNADGTDGHTIASDVTFIESGLAVEISPPRLAPPRHLLATPGTGQVDLRWGSVSLPAAEFKEYRVYYDTFSPPTTFRQSTTPGSPSDTSAVLSGLTDGVTYYFHVTTVDTGGSEGGASSEIAAIPGTIGGIVTTTTWLKASSPYVIGGKVVVPFGNTLTIEPGVDVRFDLDAEFVVKGILEAVGTQVDSIRFVPGAAAEWGGLRFVGGDSSTLHYGRISGAAADSTGSGSNGGGIYLRGKLGLAHSVVSGNAATLGGGIYSIDSHLDIFECLIAANTATGSGGGIWTGYSGTSIPGAGGGEETVILTNSVVTGNTSDDWGGGLYSQGDPVHVDSTTFSLNQAANYGGGIAAWQTTLDVTGSTFDNNTATNNGGGGIFAGATIATVSGSKLINNTANVGGAIAASSHGAANATLTVTRSVIAGNSTGIRVGQASASIDRSTLVGNAGGAISSNGQTTLTNSIVWGNSMGAATVSYSDIEGGFAGTGNIALNPMFVDSAGGDFSLQAGSPAIDAGDPNDTRDPDNTKPDMGALYRHQTSSATTVSGPIGTTTWTLVGSPYEVVAPCTVAFGNTLTIEWGVDVVFNADVPFIVEGKLHAIGTAADSIRFIKGTSPTWGGLRFSGVDTSRTEYVRISDANTVGNGGGVYISTATGHLAMKNSVISGNVASAQGAGIWAGGGSHPVLNYCVIANNEVTSAGGGGGFMANGGNITFRNCTFYGNTAQTVGGAGRSNGTGTIVSVKSSIVWGNVGSFSESVGGLVNVTYSDVQGGWAGTGNINVDPEFVDAAANGFGLLATSPAIDVGDPAGPLDPDGTRSDMGAIATTQPGTPVSGNIATGTWQQADGPYRVTGAITVTAGQTLTIEPGVDVFFNADVPFVVDGIVRAVGTVADSISFMPDVAPEWGGIRVSGDSSTLHYARITGGNADGLGALSSGGGIYIINGALGLAHSVIDHNAATEGGGLYAFDSHVDILETLIDANTSSGDGGGIWTSVTGALTKDCACATVILTNSTVTNNVSGNDGGGVHTMGDPVIVANSTVASNTAQLYGGGIYALGAALDVVGSTFEGNAATDNAGGAIYADRCSVTVASSSLIANTAQAGGGITASTEAPGSSALTMTATLVAGNTATSGTGAGVRVGNFTKAVIDRSTIVGNIGATEIATNGTTAVTNSIVWGNPFGGASTTVTYSDILGGYAGVGNFSADPMFTDSIVGDFSLQAGSPAIDSGDPSRFDPDGTTLDMGAFAVDHGGTGVGGTVYTTTWTKPNSPYRVTSRLDVPPGNTLTIEPGVDVLFTTDTEFAVGGALHAVGTQADSIRFLKGTASEWGGLLFDRGDTSTMAYARVSDVSGAVVGAVFAGGAGTRLGMANTVLSGNHAPSYGGGLTVGDTASANLTDCDIVSNTAGNGGGILVWRGNVVLTNCLVDSNEADSGLGGGIVVSGSAAPPDGGGCEVCDKLSRADRRHRARSRAAKTAQSAASLTLVNTIVTRNTAAVDGGGIYVEDATVTITGCNISNNFAAQFGGGLEVNGGSILTMYSTTVAYNNADDDGGGLDVWDGSTLTMMDCVVRDNTALTGGGFYLEAVATLTRCLVSGNTDSEDLGGAFALYTPADLTLTNSTVSGNVTTVSAVEGGGIAIYDALVTLTLENTILWGDKSDEIYIAPAIAPTIVATYSDIEGDTVWAGTGNINVFPQFADSANGDYSLLVASPCIDVGNPSSPNDPDGTRIDMGAYYYDQRTYANGSTGTTTWFKAESPYHVSGEVIVAAGDTLTIEPGVDVLFDADVKLVVHGVLDAWGTQADSIRFVAGASPQWRGIRFSGGDTSGIAYTRISGGNARAGGVGDANGGAIWATGAGTHVELSHVLLRGNDATNYGGGLYVDADASVDVDSSVIDDNTGLLGGGVFSAGGDVWLCRNVITTNHGSNGGGGLFFQGAGGSRWVENCTFVGNTAGGSGGGGMFVQSFADATVRSSIFGGNTPNQLIVNGTASVTYSDIAGGWAGTGNIDSDPLFVDDVSGDFHLTGISPCINSGSPDSPLDPDGTRADMGAFHFPGTVTSQLALPNVSVASGDSAVVSVTATIANSMTAGLWFTVDTAFVDTVYLKSHAFESGALALGPDTIKVDLSSASAVTLSAETIAEVVFKTKATAVRGDMPMAWVPFPATHVDVQTVDLTDGQFGILNHLPEISALNDTVIVSGTPMAFVVDASDADADSISYTAPTRPGGATFDVVTRAFNWTPGFDQVGDTLAVVSASDGIAASTDTVHVTVLGRGDVTKSGDVTALDASWVLQQSVKMRADLDSILADVTANGSVSAYDGALILYRAANSSYLFPSEGGAAPKIANAAPRIVSWQRDGDDWVLAVDEPAGIISGQMTLGLPRGVEAEVPVEAGIAHMQEGSVVRVAFARIHDESSVLFRVRTERPMLLPPMVNLAQFNEGQVPFGGETRPVAFALYRNVPNPFNPSTTIRFGMPEAGRIALTIHNASGQAVRTLLDGQVGPGVHSVIWDGLDGAGREVGSGMYLCRLSSHKGIVVRKMLLVK